MKCQNCGTENPDQSKFCGICGYAFNPIDKDYYAILQVNPNAEQEIIDAAYRRLAQKYHPDVNSSPQAAERMKAINQAYAILRDRDRRALYDRTRSGDIHAKPAPPPPSQTSNSSPETRSIDKNNLFQCPMCGVGVITVYKKSHILSTETSLRCSNCGAEAKEVKPGQYGFDEWPDRLSYMAAYYQTFEGKPQFWEAIAKLQIPDKTIDEIESGKFAIIPAWGQVDSQLLLESGEQSLIARQGVIYSEERTRIVSDGYSGMSLPLARGVRIYSGRGSSHPVSSMTKLDRGTFCLTNKRYAFIGSTKTVSAPISKIVSVSSFADGISIARTGKQKIEYFGNVPGIIFGTAVRQIIREIRNPETYRQSPFSLEGARYLRAHTTG